MGKQNKFSFKVSDADFKKSSYSHPGGIINRCVSVATTSNGVAMRDTKDSNKKTLYFTNDEWRAFVDGVKSGEFDSK